MVWARRDGRSNWGSANVGAPRSFPDRCATPQSCPAPAARLGYGASSNTFGSPHAEFEIPYGHLGPERRRNAQIAPQGTRTEFGYDARARVAKIAVEPAHERPARHTDAVFHGQPITVQDVLDSPMIADPLHKLEIVMPCQGGAGVVIANADVARRRRHTVPSGSRASASASPSRRRPTPRTCCARRSARRPSAPSRWPASEGTPSTWLPSTTAKPSRY